MAFSYNVYDDVDVGRIPRATDAPPVRSIRLKPAREGRPEPTPELQGPLAGPTASARAPGRPPPPRRLIRLALQRASFR